MKYVLPFLIGILFFSCTAKTKVSSRSESSDKLHEKQQNEALARIKDSLASLNKRKIIDSTLLINNLVDVQALNKNIRIDLKYASSDNFMHQKLYERIDRAYLQKDVAERLAKCQEFLTSIDTSLHLLVYDAFRPVIIQWKMWKALDTIPSKERGKFVSSPVNKSLHNYGAAVDLTICNSRGEPLDMGAGFDDIRQIAYPSMESHFLASGELTQEHIDNRNLLRKVMRSQGFRNLSTEWWHFNACSRADAKLKYKVLETEP